MSYAANCNAKTVTILQLSTMDGAIPRSIWIMANSAGLDLINHSNCSEIQRICQLARQNVFASINNVQRPKPGPKPIDWLVILLTTLDVKVI